MRRWLPARWGLTLPVLALLAVLQGTLIPTLPLPALHPNLLLLAAVARTLLRGPFEGVWWAFLGGVLLGVLDPLPQGIAVLGLLLAVWTTWLVDRILLGQGAGVVALAALLAAPAFYLPLLPYAHLPLREATLRLLALQALVHGSLLPLLFPLIRRLDGLWGEIAPIDWTG